MGLAGFALFLASAFTPLPNLLSGWAGTLPRVQPADAIVVLGGGAWPDGTLSNSSLRRAVHGIRLHRKGLAPLLLLLGPGYPNGPREAEVRAALARELGIPPEAIVTDAGAWTTREEGARVKALLSPKGARRILLVTDSQHMVRAQRVFERAGFEVLPSPADEVSATANIPGDRLKLTRFVLQEFLARLYYRAAGYL